MPDLRDVAKEPSLQNFNSEHIYQEKNIENK